ncbi:MAG TPA: ABC transporter ATP-binding protein [Thermomicrobiales bacterium]|nr:ABC transporter ATP-binding protein [Thermomicrobiales bacterium]
MTATTFAADATAVFDNRIAPDLAISARGLHKHFGQTAALRGVNLDVARGEVLAVMGPSGSGKSTLLHCLAGVLLPDSGTVQIGDTEITALAESNRARLRLQRLGFVFQFGQLLPELSVLDNVSIPLLLSGMRRSEAQQLAHEQIRQFGLSDVLAKLPGELSGGQAQRIAMARALVTQPEILFADEPTGSLDSLASETVLNAMLDLVRQRGTTVILITHDPRTAAYADREVIVRDGRISAGAIGQAA